MSKKTPISLDEATDILSGGDKAKKKTRIGEETFSPRTTAGPEAEAGDEDRARSDADDGEGRDEAGDDGAPLDPPRFWDADSRKRFGEMPRELQVIVLAKENERNAATARALQDTAEKRKTYESHAARLSGLLASLDRLMPEAARTFQNRWAGMDWNKVSDKLGPEQALKLKTQHEAETRLYQKLALARTMGAQHKFHTFVTREAAKLPIHAPELADQKNGAERKGALASFLTRLGVPLARIPFITALEAGLAYDAMKWRNGQATVRALARNPNPGAGRKLPVKQTGSAVPRSQTQARIEALSRKRHLSVDEAVELANLKGY